MRNILRVVAFFGVGLLMIARAYAAETAPAAVKPVAAQKAKAKQAVKKAAVAVAAVVEQEPKKVRRVVEGSVVHVSKRAISVEFETYEKKQQQFHEMLLPLSSEIKVEGVAALAELKRGDQVKVGIEQSFKDDPQGKEPLLVKTEALVIVLVKRAEASVEAELPTTATTVQ